MLIGTPGSSDIIQSSQRHATARFKNNIIYQFFQFGGIYINISKTDSKYYISGAGGAIGGARHPTYIVRMALMLYTHQHYEATPKKNRHASKYEICVHYIWYILQ